MNLNAAEIAALINDIGEWAVGLIFVSTIARGVLLSAFGKTR
jgi:hypothetical protein